MNTFSAQLLLLGLLVGGYLLLLFVPLPVRLRENGQFRWDAVGSSLMDRNWLFSILWFTAILVVSVGVLIQALSALAGVAQLIAVILLLGLMAATLFVLVARLIIYADTRTLSSHKLLAHRTQFNVPHERVTLRADDGTLVKGIHLKRDHKKVIVYIHAGFRTKDTLGSVMLCQWLSEHYDVFSFDLRGHGESGGFYTGDGKTVLDLLAALQYVKAFGYERIGLMGRSVGAWTAVLEEARFHNVDSLIAAALPYGYISDCPELKRIWPYMVSNWLGTILGRAGRSVRFKPHQEAGRPEDEIQNVAPTPLMLVYCESDKFLGMSHEDILKLYERASDPKEIRFLEGSCHVYEINIIHKYYSCVLDWFGRTL